MNIDMSAARVRHAEGPRSVNMDGSAASVSNVEGPQSVNMDDFANVSKHPLS